MCAAYMSAGVSLNHTMYDALVLCILTTNAHSVYMHHYILSLIPMDVWIALGEIVGLKMLA